VSEGSPPERPPQLSPDGKWVWDGSEWQPVAGRESGHQAVFSAFNSAFDPALTAPQPSLTPARPEPVANYPMLNYSPPQPAIPLWQRTTPRLNKYVPYVAVGAVVLVVAIILMNQIGSISWPWIPDAPLQAAASPTPPMPATRSEYAEAQRLWTGFLVPAFNPMNAAATEQALACNGVPTIGCQGDLAATDAAVKNVLAVAKSAPAPDCILDYLTRTEADLAGMDAGLQIALSSYTINRSGTLLEQGLVKFAAARRPLGPDTQGIAKAAVCDTQQTGP
jgi:hypothetical protein